MGPNILGKVIKPAIGTERIVLGKRCDISACSDQRLNQVRSNETIGASDKDAFTLKIIDHNMKSFLFNSTISTDDLPARPGDEPYHYRRRKPNNLK
jgi:hypothetical protein